MHRDTLFHETLGEVLNSVGYVKGLTLTASHYPQLVSVISIKANMLTIHDTCEPVTFNITVSPTDIAVGMYSVNGMIDSITYCLADFTVNLQSLLVRDALEILLQKHGLFFSLFLEAQGLAVSIKALKHIVRDRASILEAFNFVYDTTQENVLIVENKSGHKHIRLTLDMLKNSDILQLLARVEVVKHSEFDSSPLYFDDACVITSLGSNVYRKINTMKRELVRQAYK